MNILKKVSSKVVPKTLFKLCKGWKSNLRYLHIWGCSIEVKVYHPQLKKLDPRIVSKYFINYVENSKGFMFYCPSNTLIIVRVRNVKFIENNDTRGSYIS